MLNLNDVLYFSSVENNQYATAFWKRIEDNVPWDGKWYVRIADKVPPSRLVSRSGEWTTPWPQELIPKFNLPKYDPHFSKTFEQVTDETAQRVAQRIRAGEKFALMWSGGIDSTTVLASLIKNLTDEELKSVTVLCNIESIVENPTFYQNFVHNKLNILDSGYHKYDDLIRLGFTPITADEGDCIFGTLVGLGMYNNFDALIDKAPSSIKNNLKPLKNKISDPDTHFSNFKELLIQYFNTPWHPDFGRIFYDKCIRNIETTDVPIHSLHDFFWWHIFNVKYINCAARGAIYYNDTLEFGTAVHKIFNWFNEPDYQRWSMANNNKGLKIENNVLSYKKAAKDYIFDLDKNIWYHTFKTKIISLNNISRLQSINTVSSDKMPAKRVAVKKDGWELLHLDDVGVEEYFTHHLSNYKIDWTDV